MERRDFLKVSAITGAAAVLDSCGNPEHELIRFIPEEDLVPGQAVWKPSICTLCRAGCGVLARVMEGEAEVIRNGRHGLIKMGLAKKLEGNPRHPVSQGKLCARGQAGLQLTYHPDRVRNPLKRSGPRGSGEFQEISWDEAIQVLASKLAPLRGTAQGPASLYFLTRPMRSARRQIIERFLKAFNAPAPVSFELFDDAVLRRANARSFGRPQLATFDLARSNYVISFGADFLGTWNSPVSQGMGYGEMRQGRPGLRAKFVQVEPRMSLTGANADEWVPTRPGTEGVFALGLAHTILKEKLRPAGAAGRAGALIDGWAQGLPDYTPEKIERATGVVAARVTRLAREMATHDPAVAMIGGAPLAQTNGLFNALAVNALNALLGSVEKPGGILFTPQPSIAQEQYFPVTPSSPEGLASILELVEPLLNGHPGAARVLLLYDANPVFALPAGVRVSEALGKIPFIASFGSFIDETSVLADLILPDHSPLESWLDDIPESGTAQLTASVAPPAVRPLYNTRAMPDVLLDVSHQLGPEFNDWLPWKSYEEMLRARFEKLGTVQVEEHHSGPLPPQVAVELWNKAQEQGGWWSTEAKNSTLPVPALPEAPAKFSEPEFDGPEKEFPFHFLPFPSPMFLDGSLAHLPWMQETPDPLSTAMWGAWVEINPQTADRLNIRQGDLLEIESRHGKVRAPALISPGIAPDIIAMPVGQGHDHYGRYANGRGANPLALLATLVEPETKSLAWAATRVRVSPAGKGKLILFAGGLRERPHEFEQR